MRIFRQDKIELTRGDWIVITTYVLGMVLWLGFRFYSEGYGLLRCVTLIILAGVEILASFFTLKWLIEQFFLRRKQIFFGVVAIVASLILIGCGIILLDHYLAGFPLREIIFPLSAFVIDGLNSSLLDVAILIGFVFSKKSYDQLVNNKNLAIENRENALKILRAQFSPHFLYNNLNTIDALIDDRPAVAKQYVNRLAALYRYLSDTSNQDIVPLADELAFIRNYLFLLEIRYGEDYRFDVVAERPTADRFLPSGALQTVVENVVKHNAIDGRQLVTRIEVTDESVRVRNDKGIRAATASSGTGLQNLRRRYELLGAPAVAVTETDQHFTVQLPLIPVTAI